MRTTASGASRLRGILLDADDLRLAAGVGLVMVGVWMIYVPAALIVPGVALIAATLRKVR